MGKASMNLTSDYCLFVCVYVTVYKSTACVYTQYYCTNCDAIFCSGRRH